MPRNTSRTRPLDGAPLVATAVADELSSGAAMNDKPRPTPVAASSTDRSPYHGYRFPPEIIAHAVWLYFRFHLSFRDVEDLLAERGISVSHEAIRQWCTKFGAAFASGLRRRRARPGDKWQHRRGSVEDQRQTSLVMAGGGSVRRRFGHPGPVAA